MSKLTAKGNVSYRAQYFATFSATMGAFAMGNILGYSSPAESLLANNSDPNLNLTDLQLSWFSSTLTLGALVSAPVGGFAIAHLGRRGTMIYSIFPYIIGWLLIASAKNFAMLILGRIVTGFCCGITSLVVPTYIGEFSSPEIRGFLGSCFHLLGSVGVLFSFVVGTFLTNFHWIAAICLVPPFLHSGTMLLNKESPVFLLSKGRDDDASKALEYFRGKNYDINLELNILKQNADMKKQNKRSFKDLKAPYILKPLFISLGLMIFRQLSGGDAILFNLHIIFEEADRSLSDSIIVILVAVLSTGLGTVLMDKVGRKILLLISAALLSVCLGALGVYFYLKENSSVENLGWLPLTSLILGAIAGSIGFGPVPWIMMAEIYSSDIREVAVTIAILTNWTFAFVVTKTFIPLTNILHNYGMYFLLASLNVASFIFVTVFVYETKGKSIEEITAHFGAPLALHCRSGQQGV